MSESERSPRLDLEETKRLLAAATVGPWIAEDAQEGIPDGCAWGVVSRPNGKRGEGLSVIECDFVGPSNAKFIAHARSAVPALVAELESARAEIDRLRAALVGLVGAGTREELEQMELVMRSMPAPEEDKAASLNAIHALLAAVSADAPTPHPFDLCSCGHERESHHVWGKCHGLKCKCTGFVLGRRATEADAPTPRKADWIPECPCGRQVLNEGDKCTQCLTAEAPTPPQCQKCESPMFRLWICPNCDSFDAPTPAGRAALPSGTAGEKA